MPPTVRMTYEETPEPADIAVVGRGLSTFNRRFDRAGATGADPLVVLLRDAEGAVVGGIVAETNWGWLHVELLWVEDDFRGQGHGADLLAAAEREAIRRGCRHAHLDTFSFQAPAFYLAGGYTVFGQLEEFPPGQRRFFMTKRLGEAKPDAESARTTGA